MGKWKMSVILRVPRKQARHSPSRPEFRLQSEQSNTMHRSSQSRICFRPSIEVRSRSLAQVKPRSFFMDRPYGISDFAFPNRWDRETGPDVLEMRLH
jgi:hypothetical protein